MDDPHSMANTFGILMVHGKTLYAYYMLVLSASISRRIVYKEPPETC